MKLSKLTGSFGDDLINLEREQKVTNGDPGKENWRSPEEAAVPRPSSKMRLEVLMG